MSPSQGEGRGFESLPPLTAFTEIKQTMSESQQETKELKLEIGHIFVERPQTGKLRESGAFKNAVTGESFREQVIIGKARDGQFFSARVEQRGQINPEIGGTILPTQRLTLIDRISPEEVSSWITKWAMEKKGMGGEEAQKYLQKVKSSLGLG